MTLNYNEIAAAGRAAEREAIIEALTRGSNARFDADDAMAEAEAQHLQFAARWLIDNFGSKDDERP